MTALSTKEGQSGSPDPSCVKGPSHSFTVNKQCLKLCLVFCSYGCYSSGRLLPGPASLPGLVAVGSPETGFRAVGWAPDLPASSQPLSRGARGSSLLTPPTRPGRDGVTLPPASQKQLGDRHAHGERLRQPLPTGLATAPTISPLCLHCQTRAHWES